MKVKLIYPLPKYRHPITASVFVASSVDLQKVAPSKSSEVASDAVKSQFTCKNGKEEPMPTVMSRYVIAARISLSQDLSGAAWAAVSYLPPTAPVSRCPSLAMPSILVLKHHHPCSTRSQGNFRQ